MPSGDIWIEIERQPAQTYRQIGITGREEIEEKI